MWRYNVSEHGRSSDAVAVCCFVSGRMVLESMWTQVLILHFLRTRKIPFVQSSPSIPVVCTTFAGIIVFTSLTFTKSAGVIGLTKLPIMYFLFLFVVVLLYMLLTTVVKTVYQKKYHELI